LCPFDLLRSRRRLEWSPLWRPHTADCNGAVAQPLYRRSSSLLIGKWRTEMELWGVRGRGRNGSPLSASRPPISSAVAPGRTVISKASTHLFATSSSMAKSSTRRTRRTSSSIPCHESGAVQNRVSRLLYPHGQRLSRRPPRGCRRGRPEGDTRGAEGARDNGWPLTSSSIASPEGIFDLPPRRLQSGCS
jgi:hypothetical protein